jgi:hypothetical protein
MSKNVSFFFALLFLLWVEAVTLLVFLTQTPNKLGETVRLVPSASALADARSWLMPRLSAAYRD